MDTSCEIFSEVMSKVEHLPPMPTTITKVMEMSCSEDYSSGELAEVVMEDPTLATRVLKLCNSGFVGLGQEVTSIQRAVVLLGFEMVKNLVFSSFVHSAMQGDVSGYAQTAESLWEHSMGTATAALVIAEKCAPQLTETAYTGGLIHDIGKVVMAAFVGEKFAEVVERMRKRRQRSFEAEMDLLGTTHSEVGGLVAERWRLAADLQDAIIYHHDPKKAESSPILAAIVCCADTVCGVLGMGAGLEATDAELPEEVLSILGLDDAALEEVSGEIMKRLLALQHSDVLEGL